MSDRPIVKNSIIRFYHFPVCNAGYFGTASTTCTLCTENTIKPEIGDSGTCDEICPEESSRPSEDRTECSKSVFCFDEGLEGGDILDLFGASAALRSCDYTVTNETFQNAFFITQYKHTIFLKKILKRFTTQECFKKIFPEMFQKCNICKCMVWHFLKCFRNTLETHCQCQN